MRLTGLRTIIPSPGHAPPAPKSLLSLWSGSSQHAKRRVFFSVSTRLLASACLDGAGGGVTLEQKEVYPGVDPVSPNIRPSPPRSRKKKKDIRLAAGLFFFFLAQLRNSWGRGWVNDTGISVRDSLNLTEVGRKRAAPRHYIDPAFSSLLPLRGGWSTSGADNICKRQSKPGGPLSRDRVARCSRR